MNNKIIFLLSLLVLLLFVGSFAITNNSKVKYKYSTIITGLNHPWSVIWLDDENLLISERNGDLLLISSGKKIILEIPVFDVYAYGQGGLLDLAKHPDYYSNSWIYLSYSAYDDNKGGASVKLARFKIQNNAISNWQDLYQAKPYINSSHHFSGRIAFDNNNYIYLSVGDRGKRYLAQNTTIDIGKILRLKDDGTIPKDNPFNNAVFSYGHRNIQGLIWYDNGLIANEHGPQGGDELNYIARAKNYGWPIITYGKEYVSGIKIGIGTHKEGMAQPAHYWVPSIAPSGLAVYRGDKFNKWRNNLLIGSLKFKQLVKLEIKDKKIIDEKRLFSGIFGRIRDVKVHNGDVYLLIDSANGSLIKLIP